MTLHALISGILISVLTICYDLDLKIPWSCDPITEHVVGPLKWQVYDDLSQSEGRKRQSRYLRHTCQSVGQKKPEKSNGFFSLSEISEGLWFVEISVGQLKEKSLLYIFPLYLWVVIAYLLMSQEAALLIGASICKKFL